jgi:hypothetical protein
LTWCLTTTMALPPVGRTIPEPRPLSKQYKPSPGWQPRLPTAQPPDTPKMYEDSWYSFVPDFQQQRQPPPGSQGARHRRKESLLQQPDVRRSPPPKLSQRARSRCINLSCPQAGNGADVLCAPSRAPQTAPTPSNLFLLCSKTSSLPTRRPTQPCHAGPSRTRISTTS